MTTTLTIPKPYPRQVDIASHPAKRKVVCAGRRAGKTMMGAFIAVGGQAQYGFNRGLLDGCVVFISSTSQDQSDFFWDYITTWLKPLVGTPGFKKNEGTRLIKLGKGRIKVKTGRNADALRGGYADTLILDECAYLDPDAWRKVGMPMLVDNDGDAYLLSTPKRRNWFFEEFAKASDPERDRWHAWNFTSHENPHLPEVALNELIEDMDDATYEQEILAQFLDSEGAVFRRIDDCATLTRGEVARKETHTYVMGVDWAQKQDFSVCLVMDADTMGVVDYDRFRRMDWTAMRARVERLYNQWGCTVALAEHNSIGSPNIEELRKTGMRVKPFDTTSSSKPPLIESLVLAFDKDAIRILNDDTLKNELKAYEKAVSLRTGHPSYNAPSGMHDDMVMALALAYKAAREAPSSTPRRVVASGLYPSRQGRQTQRRNTGWRTS